MTDTKDVATSWLQDLAARGVTATIRNGRLWLHPSSAYKSLTDAEVLTLRHRRQEIKEAIKNGVSFDVVRAAPIVEKPTPAPEPEKCRWCGRAPCIGVEHPVFYDLHPNERQRRDDEQLTAEMRACIGRPHRMWDGLL